MDAVVSPVLQAYVTPAVAVVLIVAVGWAGDSRLLTLAVTVGTAVSLKTAVVIEAVAPF
jgi:hypothetical protein